MGALLSSVLRYWQPQRIQTGKWEISTNPQRFPSPCSDFALHCFLTLSSDFCCFPQENRTDSLETLLWINEWPWASQWTSLGLFNYKKDQDQVWLEDFCYSFSPHSQQFYAADLILQFPTKNPHVIFKVETPLIMWFKHSVSLGWTGVFIWTSVFTSFVFHSAVPQMFWSLWTAWVAL